MDIKSDWQKEFFSLARVYLACRWRAMGNEVINGYPGISLEFSLRGLVDYSTEMRLLLIERKKTFK